MPLVPWLAGASPVGASTNATLRWNPAAARTAPAKPAVAGALSHYLVAWGSDSVGQTEVPDGISNITAVSAGYNHGLARRANGAVVAWGANGSGQASVPAGLNATAVAAGYDFSLALKSDGTVAAWGDPANGETTVPAGLTDVTAIAAGYSHALALQDGGAIVAWGRNTDGEATVPGGLHAGAVAAGDSFSLALRGDETVAAWGDDSLGQTDVPAGLSGVIAIAAGGDHSLALKDDHTVVAWGDDSFGQTDVPAGLTNVTAIAAGGDHSLALKDDGTVVAWGDNFYGQTSVPAGLCYVAAISAGFNFSAALTQPPTLELTGLTSPRTAGAPGTLTVMVRSHDGSVDTGYTGSVHFSSTDPVATLPADYTFTPTDAGSHDFAATLKTAGVQSLTVADTANSLIAGSQSVVVDYVATTYHAIPPARVLDTRASNSTWTNIGLWGPFISGKVRTFHVAGAHYVGGGTTPAVPATATAVTGNVTIVNETAEGVVAMGASVTATGEVTTINFSKGDVRANNVTLGLAPDGTLQAVFRAATEIPATNVIFDVTGYFLPDTGGDTYHTLPPGRVLDSRPTNSIWKNIGLSGKFKSKVVRSFKVAGAAGIGWAAPQVPLTATAVTGNVTVTNATANGFLSLGPSLPSVPKTSTVNVKKGQNCANGVTVALNAGNLRAVWVGGTSSTADVIFDVTGYFTHDASGLSFHPVPNYRVLSSSSGKGLSGAFTSGHVRMLAVGGTGGPAGVPMDAAAIAGNLTLVYPSSNGYAYAADAMSGTPKSSTVNTTIHVTVANGLDVKLNALGQLALVWVGTTGSTANLQLDITGYWK